MLAIETTNLSRSFKGKPAVRNLNMRVPEGSIYGFIGQKVTMPVKFEAESVLL